MYISLDWVNELVNIKKVNLKYLIEKLTLGGFEVEKTLELNINEKKKTILDISATANRADSLSVIGISKEIKALLNLSTVISNYTQNNNDFNEIVQEKLYLINKSVNYSTILTITVENLTDLTVPKWIKNKLFLSGIQPVNNLLDFKNYILLETGYPFEFYDLDKIKKKIKTSNFNLTLKPETKNRIFLAANDFYYQLTSELLILEANNFPLSIAGIISNKEVCYENSTKSLLIEGSIFNSAKIRQQSRILKIRTERSARYEKGLNNAFLIDSFWRLISLLKISNPNLVCKIHTTSQKKTNNILNVCLNYKKIIEILGPIKTKKNKKTTYLQPDQVSLYLNQLHFSHIFEKKTLSWQVQIPKVRMDDIEREIDLIEEIGRLHGFNSFITSLPIISKIGIEDFSYQTRKKITKCFLNEGFNELIHYSLVNKYENENATIKLINPLITDCSKLRFSLLPDLVKTITENLKQNNLKQEGFEYGHVFSCDKNFNWLEKEQIAGIFGGTKRKRNWNETAKDLSWFEGKGKMEELFKKLNIVVLWKTCSLKIYKDILHPYRTAEIYLSNHKMLGVFGQIHPSLAKKYTISSKLFLFELNFELLKNQLKNVTLTSYRQYSLYPRIVKDISFIVRQTILYDSIRQTILEYGTNFLTNIELIDKYSGNTIPDNCISLCIQLTFQSNDTTLLNKKVENILLNIQNNLEKLYSVKVRI